MVIPYYASEITWAFDLFAFDNTKTNLLTAIAIPGIDRSFRVMDAKVTTIPSYLEANKE